MAHLRESQFHILYMAHIHFHDLCLYSSLSDFVVVLFWCFCSLENKGYNFNSTCAGLHLRGCPEKFALEYKSV